MGDGEWRGELRQKPSGCPTDDLKNKASELVGKHGDKAEDAIDRGGDMAKGRTGSNESDTGNENR